MHPAPDDICVRDMDRNLYQKVQKRWKDLCFKIEKQYNGLGIKLKS